MMSFKSTQSASTKRTKKTTTLDNPRKKKKTLDKVHNNHLIKLKITFTSIRQSIMQKPKAICIILEKICYMPFLLVIHTLPSRSVRYSN